MKIRWIRAITFLTVAGALTGCGNVIPEMDEEQQALVVEYAAGELLKYDANYDYRLNEELLEQETQPEEAAPEESQPETPPSQSPEDTAGALPSDAAGNLAEALPEETPTKVTLEDFLELEKVSMTYTGYEITEFYPHDTEDIYFVMNATDGNELLVLKFLAENNSAEDADIDIAQKNIRFRIIVNGEEKNALTTMLLNDMGYYKETLAAGESAELVLVCEIPEGQEKTVQSLELLMRSNSSSATISLQGESLPQ